MVWKFYISLVIPFNSVLNPSMDMILDPTILFFCLGAVAVWVKSNIEIPAPTMKFLSYYLLMSIGFKGGISLAKLEFSSEIFLTIFAGIIASALIPIWIYFVLKKRLSSQNAGAAAACYGSVSAVTFLTAISWLENRNLEFGGHMVALMALMESPAIIVGILLAKKSDSDPGEKTVPFNLKQNLHEAFFNGSVFILIGSLLIGAFMNPDKAADYQVFVYDIFKGFLCFFLLDLGMSAARQIKELKNNAIYLSAIAILAPIINGTIGIFIASLLQLNVANGFLFAILLGSASYIAVPAAIKTSLPGAQPSVFLSMSLGLTFPFNILIGIPMFWGLAQKYLSN